MLPVIPSPDDPNAGKSPQEIEREKQQERYRLENLLQDKLYQKMVKVIGKVSMKSDLNGEDKLMVINAVKNYASKKSTIPHSPSSSRRTTVCRPNGMADEGPISHFHNFQLVS